MGAVALVLDLAKGFERVSLSVVWAWVTHFQLFKEDIAGAVCTRGECSLKVVWRSPAPDYHGHASRVKVELLASAYCVAQCFLVWNVTSSSFTRTVAEHPSLTQNPYDITALSIGKSGEVAEMAKKVMRKFKRGSLEKDLKLSIKEKVKEGQSKMIVSCRVNAATKKE